MDEPEPVRLVQVEGRLPYASNATLLARSEDGRLWVYKPSRGEEPLWDFPWGSLAAREVLAFEVSEVAGLGVVPETRLADGPLGPGSAQTFLEEDVSFDPRTLVLPSPDPRVWPVAILDLVTNQADRKLGHLLVDVSGRLWAIDNGLTFHPAPKLRTVLWGLAGRRIPDRFLAGLEELTSEELCRRIAELLSMKEAAAFQRRVEEVLTNPVHPPPPEDRPAVPWPVW
jgi:hypothetical protein